MAILCPYPSNFEEILTGTTSEFLFQIEAHIAQYLSKKLTLVSPPWDPSKITTLKK